jgi:hypothetical protein
MKLFKQAMKYGAVVPVFASPLFAHATGNPLVDALTSIDLTGVGVAVAAMVLLIIGIALSFKGGDLGKRAIRKV